MLSRTIETNSYRLHPSALLQSRLHFDFDLYGSALSSLAPSFCSSLSYRPRRLSDCPPLPALSVAAPPWNRILALLSEAAQGSATQRCNRRILLILPHWPAQPWWPLAVRLAENRLLEFKGTPWVGPSGRRAPYGAIALWVHA
jgi:hypothetical protein